MCFYGIMRVWHEGLAVKAAGPSYLLGEEIAYEHG